MKMLWNTAVETLLCHSMRIRTIPNKGLRSTYSLTSSLIQQPLAKCKSVYRKSSTILWTTSCSYFDHWYFPSSDVTRFRTYVVYFLLYFQHVIAVEGAPTRISFHSACRCVLILSRVLTMVQYIRCGIVCSVTSVSRPVFKKIIKNKYCVLGTGSVPFLRLNMRLNATQLMQACVNIIHSVVCYIE